MSLKRSGERLVGLYRYEGSSDDLELTGIISAAGAFEIDERNGDGTQTGKLKGVIASSGPIEGTWSSPDATKALPFKLHFGDTYVPVVRVGRKVRVYPVFHSYGLRTCSADVVYPQIVGMASRTQQDQTNEALRAFGQDDIDQDFCQDVPEATGDNDAFINWHGTRSYVVTALKQQLVGLYVWGETYTGGMHGMHQVDCKVLDTVSGQLFSPKDRLATGKQAAFEAVVNRALDGHPDVIAIRAEGRQLGPAHLDDATDYCLKEHGLSALYGDYALGRGFADGPMEVEIPAKDLGGLFDAAFADIAFR
jgi:hypothetical protein